MTKGLFNLDLDEREPRGFQPWNRSCGNQGALQLRYELWRLRGFSTSILMKGNLGDFQPRNWSCGDQGAFQP